MERYPIFSFMMELFRKQRSARRATTAVLAAALGGTSSCVSTSASTYESPQFQGGRFVNAFPINKPAAWKIARHILLNRNGRWPERTLSAGQAPQPTEARTAGQVGVTVVNHATVLIELDGLRILTDPVWSDRVGPLSFFGPHRAREPGVRFEDLPPIDVVLISHNHYDHLDLPTLERLHARDRPRFFVPLGDRALLEDAGIDRVSTFDWWDHELVGDAEFFFTPAQHNSGRGPFDADRSLWGGFLIRHGGRTIFFAGDTALAGHFEQIRKRFGAIDLAFLPIGAYLPRDTTQPFHMSPEEAVRAQQVLAAPLAIAIHFGTFQLSGEDFDQPVRDLRHALAAAGRPPRSFQALQEGFPITVDLGAGEASIP